MYLWIISLLVAPVFANDNIHTVAGIKYKVKVNAEQGTCSISEYYGNGRVQSPWIANVTYRTNYNRIGWDSVEVETNPVMEDMKQAHGAGYCEGALTCESIFQHWTNILKHFCDDQVEFCKKVNDYLDANWLWVDEMINKKDESYWHQVQLFNEQIVGIYYGQKKCGTHSLTKREIIWMNLIPEIEEMKDAFNVSQMSSRVRGSSRCSAIVKLLPDYSDLLVAHDTFVGYEWMLRQVKKYNLGYHLTVNSKDIIPGRIMVSSGYPGTIPSIDDFYIVNTGLVVLETTIGNSNKDIWRGVEDPVKKVSSLIRSIVSNRLSRNGAEWGHTFSDYNNGLYNNQWMIVDMKQFTPGFPPMDGTLTVVEQIPSFIVSQKKTETLNRQSYWPSYNIPSSSFIFKTSGNEELVKKFGDWFSYENSPRAKIFQRDHSKVVDTATLLDLMRYNDYKNDPFSRCNCTPPYSAENAIASRCDLNPDNGTYPFPALSHQCNGAIDVKITSFFLANDLKFSAICGPTNGTNLPEFDWSKSDFKDNVSHVGQPDVFHFPLYTTNWTNENFKRVILL